MPVMQVFERISGEGFPKRSHPAENDFLLKSTIIFKASFEGHSFGCLFSNICASEGLAGSGGFRFPRITVCCLGWRS